MAASKEKILSAAIAALARKPDSTYSELAVAIGIGRATLYRHFPRRDALIREICLYSLRKIDTELMPIFAQTMTAMDALYAMLEKLIPMGERLHFLSREYAVMEDEEIARIYARQLEALRQMIAWAKQEGGIAMDIPDAWIARVIDSMIYMAWEAIEDGDIARNDAAELVFRTLTTGFAADERG